MTHRIFDFLMSFTKKHTNSGVCTACLPTGAPKEVCPLGLTPTTSTTVMTVIGDLLVVGTMKRINFGYPDYAKRHHGGYLGSKSREQCKTVNK